MAEKNENSLPPKLGMNPWLVLFHGRRQQFQSFYNIVDLSVHHKCIPELKGSEFLGCFYGHLLMLDEYYQLYLLNLSTMSRILLPLLDINQFCNTSAIVSAPPSDPDSIVILKSSDEQSLFYCYLIKGEWKELKIAYEYEEDSLHDCSMIIYMKKIYIITFYGSLLVISLPSLDAIVIFVEIEDDEYESSHLTTSVNLVECNGNMYQVIWKKVQPMDKNIKRFVVLKFVLENSEWKSFHWKPVRSIEKDYVFFVGDRQGGFAYHSPSAGTGVQGNLESNCIYVTAKENKGRVFTLSVDNGDISSYLACSKLSKVNAFWISAESSAGSAESSAES